MAERVREVGSELNGKRPELRRVLSDPSTTVIVVEHRDRLARFGVEHLDTAADDLVRDMIEVLTSMCAGMHGRRGARNRTLRAVTAAEKPDVDVAA